MTIAKGISVGKSVYWIRLLVFKFASFFANAFVSFMPGVNVIMDAAADPLVFHRAEYFVGACLFSDLLETVSEHLRFEPIQILVLQGVQSLFVQRVMGVDPEVIGGHSQVRSEQLQKVFRFVRGHALIDINYQLTHIYHSQPQITSPQCTN